MAIRPTTLLAVALIGLLGASACRSSPTASTTVFDVPTLQMIDVVVGTGTEATTGRSITVHYTGWLYNPGMAENKGLKVDSSVDRNQPFPFVIGVGEVIQGWDFGVRGMRVGGKRTLIIPASLAYGSRGSGAVPPNSALVFDIELLAVR